MMKPDDQSPTLYGAGSPTPSWPSSSLPVVMKQQIERLPDRVALLKYSRSGLHPITYLLADQDSGTAAVIDPGDDVDLYLEDAWRAGTRIKHLFLTQVREKVSPRVQELCERAAATIYAGAWARPDVEFMPLKEGDALEFGRVRLRISEVPGHRLEAILILMSDCQSSDQRPLGVFTGETVLIGDVGRPEPHPEDGFGTPELAAMLHASLVQKIRTLPEMARLWPSRESEVDLYVRPSCTIGAQLGFNPGFQTFERDEFVRRISAGMLDEPVPADESGLRIRPAAVGEVLRAQRAGTQVIDTRDPARFAAAHFAGSINLPSMSDFEEWAGTVVDRERPIVLVAPPGGELQSATRMLAAGFTHVAGYLRDGVSSLAEHPVLIRRRRGISYAAMGARMLSGPPTFLLDTRPAGRPALGPSVLGYTIPLERLRTELHALPRGPEIIVCDDTPYRSSAAASVLMSEGFTSVTEVAGGLALWGGGETS